MSSTTSAATAETAAERVARLKAELAAAEVEALAEQLDAACGGFLVVSADKDAAELRAAVEIVTDAWARFEAWRRAGRSGPPPENRLRRAYGAGNIDRTSTGFRWRLTRDGKVLRGQPRRTQAEAQADLDAVIADPKTYVPAAEAGEPRAPAAGLQRKPRSCTGCGSRDHDRRLCQNAVLAEAPPPPAAPPPAPDPLRALTPWGGAGREPSTPPSAPAADAEAQDEPAAASPGPDQPAAARAAAPTSPPQRHVVVSVRGRALAPAPAPPAPPELAVDATLAIVVVPPIGLVPDPQMARPRRRLQVAPDVHGDADRPRTRGDCAAMPRPCPFISCAHHLYRHVSRTGELDPLEMAETCSLDVADQGGATLEAVGKALGLTKERVRQLEERALGKMKRRGEGKLEFPDAGGLSPLAEAAEVG